MHRLVTATTAVLSVAAVLAVPMVSAAVQSTTLAPGDTLNISCATTLSVQSANAQSAVLQCAPLPVTATTTASGPSAGVPQVPGSTIDGVPVCADPGATVWHGLVERNGDGSIKCTYGYELGDNPHQVDQTFGPMGAWWNNGQEHDISYPWETMNENEMKHTNYKIVVRGSDQNPLQPWYTDSGQNYIKALRGEYHLDGPKGFVMSEYHSFEIEAQVCSRDNNCGVARLGGVQDLGERLLTHDDGSYTCLYPNPNIPSNTGLCGTNGKTTNGPRSLAGGSNDSRRDETWYGSNNKFHQTGAPNVNVDFGVILGNVWSPIHANSPMDAMSTDPNVRGDYAPHYRTTPYTPQNVDNWHHGTSVELSAFGMNLSGFPITNGRVNAKGYLDRYGNVVQGCTSMGPDCVPFSLTNVPTGVEGFRDLEYSQTTRTAMRNTNYDIINPSTGHSLIAWPN